MEDEIRTRTNTKNTRVVCRTGVPVDILDLEIVNPNASRAVIIIPNEEDDPDAQVIKTVLALTSSPSRRKEPYHIVSRIHDPANLGVVGIVGGDEAQVILVDELIARITAQTCRQSGLSIVYTDLLDFEGDEIYFLEMPPELAGKTFRDALFAYRSATVIGVFREDERVEINPPSDTKLFSSDALILIAEDDSAIGTPESPEPLQEEHIRHLEVNGRSPESTLVLGWNRRVPIMVRELDSYVAPGSRVLLVADSPETERQARSLLDAC
ncbi:MAG: CASTOR/POLLUX-related putative ion channel [Rubrobacter sp.]